MEETKDYFEQLKTLADKLKESQKTQSPCPSCGHCPTCGRGGYWGRPYYPYQPYITWGGVGNYQQPTWTYTTTDLGLIKQENETT
jgi:hypothetical protein